MSEPWVHEVQYVVHRPIVECNCHITKFILRTGIRSRPLQRINQFPERHNSIAGVVNQLQVRVKRNMVVVRVVVSDNMMGMVRKDMNIHDSSYCTKEQPSSSTAHRS